MGESKNDGKLLGNVIFVVVYTQPLRLHSGPCWHLYILFIPPPLILPRNMQSSIPSQQGEFVILWNTIPLDPPHPPPQILSHLAIFLKVVNL